MPVPTWKPTRPTIADLAIQVVEEATEVAEEATEVVVEEVVVVTVAEAVAAEEDIIFHQVRLPLLRK